MSNPTPRLWATIPLPEWHPESLPGYAEAVATVARGGSLFPERVKGAPRARRTVADLTAERDRLGRSVLPDDPGALSGIRRKPRASDGARQDRDLERYTKLTKRIDHLSHRIRKESA